MEFGNFRKTSAALLALDSKTTPRFRSFRISEGDVATLVVGVRQAEQVLSPQQQYMNTSLVFWVC